MVPARVLRVLFPILILPLFPGLSALYAQSSGATVSGRVEDTTGSAIVGAQIKISDSSNRLIASGISDSIGRFTLNGVPLGSYVLTAESHGFISARESIIVTEAGATLSLTLRVAASRESVTVTANTGYAVTHADAGTKIELPLMETPVAITVIPRPVIDDQQDTALVNAITNASGVAPTNDGYGSSDSFSIRGFDALSLLYQDGVKLDEYSTSGVPQDMANVDEIEIVKGPASVLYGQAEPGGLVNVVTKHPHPNRFATLSQEFGNHEYFRTVADVNQPLIGKQLFFRFVFDGLTANSFRNFISTDNVSAYPSLTWQPDRLVDLTIQASLVKGNYYLDNGIPFIAGVPDSTGNASASPAPVSLSANFVGPGVNSSTDQEYSIKPTLILHLSPNWPLRLLYKLEWHNNPTPNELVYAGDADPAGDLPLLGFTEDYFHSRTNQVVADMPGKFSLGPVKNIFLIGFDFYKDRGDYDYNVYVPATINVFNPVYGQPPISPIDPSMEGYNNLGFTEYGAYVQDVAELPGRVFVLGGVRLNWAEQFENYSGAGSPPFTEDVHDRPITPRAGLLWQENDHVSMYGSYTSNYGASALGLLTPTGTFLPPESADQVEFGVKSQWLEQRLTASAAVYRIIKHNVPEPDPLNPAFSLAVGAVRSQGVEADVAGKVTRDVRIIGSFSNLQAIVTTDTNSLDTTGVPSQQGLPLSGVPHSTASFWATWEPHSGPLSGFKFGGGVQNHSGEQAYTLAYDSSGNPTGGWELDRIPWVAVGNLMGGYDREFRRVQISAQLNINNVANSHYFTAVNPGQALPGAPFNLLPKLTIRF